MVVIIFEVLGPYLCARLNAAQGVLPVYGIEMLARSPSYDWNESKNLLKVPYATLSEGDAKSGRTVGRLRLTMLRVLDHVRPAVVAIPGWSDKAALAALDWCQCRGVPAVIMSDSTEWDEHRVFWKEGIKRQIVRLGATALVAGRAHVEYMEHLGMPRERIFIGYDAVDNAYFEAEVAKWRRQDREGSGAGQEDRKYFLASNRCIEKKNLFRLLDAYAAYVQSTATPGRGLWPLVMLGGGELRPKLLAHCALLGLRVIESAPWEATPTTDNGQRTTVFFPGFRQYDELPRFYAYAGAFVHASTTEQWGLVVNEAMASGLPVIVSKRCGCAHELVDNGVNGFTFDPWDVDQLAGLLQRVASPEFPLSAFGEAGRRIIAD